MWSSEPGEIDNTPPPAVHSLRSKFEKLALETANTKPADGNELLVPSGSVSPRPRASSNTPSGSLLEIRTHLRPSSSSSDLKEAAKRPPPPPPPSRALKAPQPIASPLLRPVPPPPVSNGSPRPGLSTPPDNSSSTGALGPSKSSLKGKVPGSTASDPSTTPRVASYSSVPAPEADLQDFGPSVSSIRNKFATAPASSKTRLNHGIDLEPHTANFKPPIPPRPAKPLDIPPQQLRQIPSHDDRASPPYVINVVEDRGSPPQVRPPVSREPSIASSDSDTNSLSRSSLPPRPPPRHKLSTPVSATFEASPRPPLSGPATFDGMTTISPSTSAPSLVPPPLPIRRSTIAPLDDHTSLPPPRLPNRPSILFPMNTSESPVPSPTSERRFFGSGRLPPPPTRTIGIGDKLPPPRRPPSPSSDEEEGDEEDPRAQLVAELPDTSCSSRRPPVLAYREGYPEPRIQVQAFSGSAAVAGTTVVVGHNHSLRIYDVGVSEVPVMTIDPCKEMGLKELKITTMEFRPCANRADRGYVLWVGTKEGHLFELDTRTGTISGLRHTAHLYAITHIFRHGRSMFTLDESGKGLIFAPDPESAEDISMVFTQARVVRVAEKQDFVKIIGGKLWMASRADQQIIAVPGVRAPVVRVYDMFGPANLVRNMMPMEHVGPVTTATIIPSQPGLVYVGHEEGYVTIWALEGEDGHPICLEVVKVSMSDVLCLEGVNDQLWVGGRNGMISAYDVTHKPWLVTNSWAAHPGLPVLKMSVDHYGIDKAGRLCVTSLGRDEQLRLWDGLLGVDWIDDELTKRGETFSNSRNLTMLLVSWNCDSAKPDSLTGDPANVNFLNDVLCSVDSPDIISFGFQEVIDLENRKMTAKNVLLGGKKKEDGGLSDKVTGAYKRWYDRLGQAVRQALPADVPYSVIHSESLVGLFSCVFVKHTERASLKDATITTIKRGMGGRYGNKGGIVSRFVIEDSSICLINCHLAAGQNATRQRNADIAGMLEDKDVFEEADYPLAYVGGGDGTMVLDHEIVFISGDMNYRIDHRRDAIIAAARSHDLNSLLSHDQLLREIKFNRACRLRGFSEGPLTFPPTYKYDRRSDEYDTSEKRRPPAWCDRILWRSHIPNQVRQMHYRRYEANVSDHRPISAAFEVTVKSIDRDLRQKAKAEVQAVWTSEQARLLTASKQFYIMQALL